MYLLHVIHMVMMMMSMMHVMLIEVKAMSKGKGKKAGGSHPLVMYVNVWHCMPLHGIAW